MLFTNLRSAKKRAIRDMFSALVTDDARKVKDIINAGLNANQLLTPYTFDERPLHVAVRHNSVDAAKALLDAGADPLEPFHIGGYDFSLSEAASACGFKEMMYLIKNAEADAELEHGKRNLKRPPNSSKFCNPFMR